VDVSHRSLPAPGQLVLNNSADEAILSHKAGTPVIHNGRVPAHVRPPQRGGPVGHFGALPVIVPLRW